MSRKKAILLITIMISYTAVEAKMVNFRRRAKDLTAQLEHEEEEPSSIGLYRGKKRFLGGVGLSLSPITVGKAHSIVKANTGFRLKGEYQYHALSLFASAGSVIYFVNRGYTKLISIESGLGADLYWPKYLLKKTRIGVRNGLFLHLQLAGNQSFWVPAYAVGVLLETALTKHIPIRYGIRWDFILDRTISFYYPSSIVEVAYGF